MQTLAQEAGALARDMRNLAKRLEKKYPDKARELAGAAAIMRGWHKELERIENGESIRTATGVPSEA